MFDTPSKKTLFVAPAEPIDVDQRYLVKVAKIEDEGVSKFADPAKGEKFHNLRWHFRVAHSDTKEAILNAEGDAWEHVQWTTSKTGRNPNGAGMTATARLWMEALLGRPVEDDELESRSITADMLINKVASCIFEEKEAENQQGEAYTKLVILRLSPFRAEAAKPKPAPKPEESLAF